MSFADEDDVMAVIEPLYARIVRETQGVDVSTPFRRMSYDEMLERYGSDKPDLRYGMELSTFTDLFEGSGFTSFAKVAADGGVIKGLVAPGGAAALSRKELDKLVEDAKGRGAAGLVWIAVEDGGALRSPVEKFFSSDEIDAVKKATDAVEGEVICIVADQPSRVHVALDGPRRVGHSRTRGGSMEKTELQDKVCSILADQLAVDRGKVTPEARFSVTVQSRRPNGALITQVRASLAARRARDARLLAPRSSRLSSPRRRVDLLERQHLGLAFDLVLNGFELGGGSIRIHDPQIQERVFEVLGLSHEEIEAKFGHLIRAFRYGAPPHGGIAMGIDRLAMLMAGKDAIRDVQAFPKAQSGADPLMGGPSPVDPVQLRELGIRVIEPPHPEGEH